MAAAVEDINKAIVSSMASKLKMGQVPRKPRGEACTIHKVPDEIRKEDPEAYEPRIVSIGPIHHGKPKLLPMEDIKWQFLDSLIVRHESNSLEKYITAVSNPSLVQQIAGCYSEEVIGAQCRNTFVEIMVLDGCFIIEYLLKSSAWEPMGELDFVDWSKLVKTDLLLIENQIPFSVLQVLYDSCCFRTDSPIRIIDLVMTCLSLDGHIVYYPPLPPVIHHILHLHHFWLCWTPTVILPSLSVKHRVSAKILYMYVRAFPFLLGSRRSVPQTMSSAAEICEAGITFQPNKQAGFEVTFISGAAVIGIPVLTVKETSMSRFRNLVALEEYLPDIEKPVTSFVVLMDSLIDTPEDVAILVDCGVLKSKLQGHKKVVRFFKTLGKAVNLDGNHDRLELLRLLKNVNDYCALENDVPEAKVRRMMLVMQSLVTPEFLTLFLGTAAFYISMLQTYVAFRPPKSK